MKKIIVGVLIIKCLLLPVFAQVSSSSSASQKDITRNEVIRLGENRRIKRLVLNDGTILKGYIKEIKSDSLVLVDGYQIVGGKVVAVDKSNTAREVRFDQVREIKPYRSLSGAIIIGAVGAAILVVVAAAASKD
jgi:hypothetical protein